MSNRIGHYPLEIQCMCCIHEFCCSFFVQLFSYIDCLPKPTTLGLDSFHIEKKSESEFQNAEGSIICWNLIVPLTYMIRAISSSLFRPVRVVLKIIGSMHLAHTMRYSCAPHVRTHLKLTIRCGLWCSSC